MSEVVRLPFIGKERSRILIEKGYDLEKIKNSSAEELAEILEVDRYIAYLIRKAATEASIENVPDELIAKETICPKCGNTISELEYECGRCHNQIKNMPLEDYEEQIKNYVDLFISISKDRNNIELWEKLKDVYEKLGNMEDSLDVSLKIDILREKEWRGEETIEVREEKKNLKKYPIRGIRERKFKNGIVNGFGPKIEFGKKEKLRIRIFAIVLILGIVMGSFISVFAMNPPFKVDGKMNEWANIPSYHTFDSQIRVLKMGEYGDYSFFYIGGNLKLKYGLNILIDKDRNPETGYKMGHIGSEYRINIYSSSGKLYASLYSFSSKKNQEDWNGWNKICNLGIAGGDYGFEFKVKKDIFTGISVIEVFNYGHHTPPIGLYNPIVATEVSLGGGYVTETSKIGKIYINNTYKKEVSISGMQITNLGNASNLALAIYKDGKILASGYAGSYFNFTDLIRVKDSVSFDLYYYQGGKDGETIRPMIGRVSSTESVSWTKGDGYYIGEIPNKPKIDGIFADWNNLRRKDVVEDAPENIDIVSFGSYFNSYSYFYIQTAGEAMLGNVLTVYGTNDSDRDGIPDSKDPFPHDFNNDGIRDKDSYTIVNGEKLPDVDKDGIPDYPYGNDYYLNTTIPNSTVFPKEYRGKFVSIYIGPPKGKKEIIPMDYFEIYIGNIGGEGFNIAGIKAKYLFRIYGMNGDFMGYEYDVYHNGKFVESKISFNPTRDLASGWSRFELKIPVSPTEKMVVFRAISFNEEFEDIAHKPFMKTRGFPIPQKFGSENDEVKNETSASMIMRDPDQDTIAGKFAQELKEKYYDKVNLNLLISWISTLNLSKGAEKNHVFTDKDFKDGNISHFKEEDYATWKMNEIIEKEGRRPIYRVELLNESIFCEEWENMTNTTKRWEILHWTHDLEEIRTKDKNYSNPYKINWYDEKVMRTLEWLVYKLSQNMDNWTLGYMIGRGIKSIDDARIGPFLAVYPTKDARLKDWSYEKVKGTGKTVTFQLVHWYSGTSDCYSDNDGYVKITVGSWTYTTQIRSDDNDWNAKVIFTNTNNSGSSAYIKIENWESDSGLCGGDDDYGSATMTYYITTKTWSGDTSEPHVHTSGPDGSADDWFVIESDDDNEAKLGIYDNNGDSDPMYGGLCFNDPWDNPTRVTYYSGQNYWGYGSYTASYYEFYVASGTSISVHLVPSSYNYDLYLYDLSWNQKASSTNSGTSEDDITFTADSSGYWKIMIYAADGYADWFKFWFTSGPDDKNFIDMSSTTGVSNAGYLIESYNGVTYYDTSDEWKFSVPSTWLSSGAYVYVWMKPNTNANFDIYLYDSSGTQKTSGTSGGVGQADYVLYQFQTSDQSGYWYASVVPSTSTDYGNYTIFFWCGYHVEFHAVTNNSGTHTPMDKSNGVQVSYVLFGNAYYVYPNDQEYWTVYVDRGSSYSYASESNLSNDAAGHRWISQSPPSGTITQNTSIYGYYYEQFYLTINTAHDTGYSSGELFGASQSYSGPGSGWFDAGCTVTISVDSPVTESGQTYYFVSWSGGGTGNYTGTSNPASFTIQDVTTETANWQVPEFQTPIIIFITIFVIFSVRTTKKK